MKSSYKPLGKYIQPSEGRNTELQVISLMGLSINKVFVPSIANTIGTNMATYRIIKRKQFGYGQVTSQNGDKITIALFDDYNGALISQAYIPFEVKDTNKLDPEYLMMWFRRPEFDPRKCLKTDYLKNKAVGAVFAALVTKDFDNFD